MVGGEITLLVSQPVYSLMLWLQMIAPLLVDALGIKHLPAALSIFWTVVVFPNTCKLLNTMIFVPS